MVSRIQEEEAIALIDPACIRDTLCEGVGHISKVAGVGFRVTVFATRDRGDGEIDHLIVAQLVWSLASLKTAVSQMEAAIDGLPFLSDLAPLAVPN